MSAADSVEQDKQCETCHIFFGQLDGSEHRFHKLPFFDIITLHFYCKS